MSEHTKTPWRVGSGPNKEVEIFGPMIMNASPILASLEHEPRDANAAFIVRACNAHDELVEALDALVSQIAKNDFRDSHGHDAKMLKAFFDARAVLAKARGETP